MTLGPNTCANGKRLHPQMHNKSVLGASGDSQGAIRRKRERKADMKVVDFLGGTISSNWQSQPTPSVEWIVQVLKQMGDQLK